MMEGICLVQDLKIINTASRPTSSRSRLDRVKTELTGAGPLGDMRRKNNRNHKINMGHYEQKFSYIGFNYNSN
jgi:hypothetical protein